RTTAAKETTAQTGAAPAARAKSAATRAATTSSAAAYAAIRARNSAPEPTRRGVNSGAIRRFVDCALRTMSVMRWRATLLEVAFSRKASPNEKVPRSLQSPHVGVRADEKEHARAAEGGNGSVDGLEQEGRRIDRRHGRTAGQERTRHQGGHLADDERSRRFF